MLTKSDLKVLRFVYHHQNKGVTYGELYGKFSRPRVEQLWKFLKNYEKLDYDRQGHPVAKDLDHVRAYLTYEATAEVESGQWFNLQFVLLQILLPIVIALITTFLTRALFPCR